MLALSAQASPRALKHVASNAGLLRSRVAPTTRPQLALREIPSDLRGHNIDRPAATLVCSVNHDALEQSLTLVVGRLKNNANQVNAVAPTDILSLKCPDGEIAEGCSACVGRAVHGRSWCASKEDMPIVWVHCH